MGSSSACAARRICKKRRYESSGQHRGSARRSGLWRQRPAHSSRGRADGEKGEQSNRGGKPGSVNRKHPDGKRREKAGRGRCGKRPCEGEYFAYSRTGISDRGRRFYIGGNRGRSCRRSARLWA